MKTKYFARVITIGILLFGIQPTILIAQENANNNNIRITLGGGTTFENKGVFSNSSLMFSLSHETAIWQNLSINSQINFNRQGFNFDIPALMPEMYHNLIESSIGDEQWTNFSILIGPSYALNFKKASVNLKTGLGILSVNSPSQNIKIGEEANAGLATFDGNSGGLIYSFGVDLSYPIYKNISLLLHQVTIQLSTTLLNGNKKTLVK